VNKTGTLQTEQEDGYQYTDFINTLYKFVTICAHITYIGYKYTTALLI